MSDELKAEAAIALSQLLKDIQSAKDFAIEQAPDVIREMVAYEATMAWIGTAFGLAVIAFFARVMWLARGRLIDRDLNMPDPFLCILFPVVGCIGLVITGSNLASAIQATFYPKWFIVEHLAKPLS